MTARSRIELEYDWKYDYYCKVKEDIDSYTEELGRIGDKPMARQYILDKIKLLEPVLKQYETDLEQLMIIRDELDNDD